MSDYEELELDEKIEAMKYTMGAVLRTIGSKDKDYVRLLDVYGVWMVRQVREQMERTGVNPVTGEPLDPDAMARFGFTHPDRRTAEPPMSDWWEKSVTLCEWHETDAFREMHESFRDVAGLSDNTREWLADGGVDLARAAQMTDAELLNVSRVGRVTVGKLRQFFAEREQREEAAA
jgi:hypothetical protein